MPYDIELIKRLKVGDIAAFNQLFESWSPRIYAFGMKYLRSPVDAEELVQDVFLKIWKNHKQIKVEKNFQSYLFTIAFNQIKEYFQYKGVFLDMGDSVVTDKEDHSAEKGITYRSTLDHIASLLELLPAKKQRIFRLSRFEGKSAKEIAVLMGVSSKTVDNQVSEVIGFLRDHFKDTCPWFWLFLVFFEL